MAESPCDSQSPLIPIQKTWSHNKYSVINSISQGVHYAYWGPLDCCVLVTRAQMDRGRKFAAFPGQPQWPIPVVGFPSCMPHKPHEFKCYHNTCLGPPTWETLDVYCSFCGFMSNWEEIWGDVYEPLWHEECLYLTWVSTFQPSYPECSTQSKGKENHHE